jgi:hypothetical protein
VRSSLRRRLVALAAVLIAAFAAAPELVVHSHQAGGTELARQVILRSTAPRPCAATQHFDPAESDVHPPCPGCLKGGARFVALLPAARPVAGERLANLPLPADHTPAAATARRLARGRAPPLA